MCEIMINIPNYVKSVLEALNEAGFEAYLVGGCVRDSILGRPVFDWDITTSAEPEQVMAVFSAYYCIPTGLQHGTVTVVSENHNLEITTYRCDGEYTDNRHPNSVIFTKNLRDDLSRRDFTINAMCCDLNGNFVDIFGGMEDLDARIIRAVGDPDERFNEDGLRIMRCIRFASQLDFSVEEATRDAVFRNKHLLKNISRERIFAELMKLLTGVAAQRILSEYGEIIFEIIPELRDQYHHKQIGKKHAYDIWEHTCHAVGGIDNDKILRLTMLLHDCGKATTETFAENGDSQFKNHAAVGGEIAYNIMKSLKVDNYTLNTVSFLVKNHDKKVPLDEVSVRKYRRVLGDENFLRLMKIRKADRGALADGYNDISEMLKNALEMYDKSVQNNDCCTLSSLAVTGKDIGKLGYRGEEIGRMLDIALEAVIEEKIQNTKSDILNFISNIV